jgi:hypothetical protein
MTTGCPCYGRNANCRFCGGSGLISSESEVKVVRSSTPTYFSGQSETQKRLEAKNKKYPASSTPNYFSGQPGTQKRIEAEIKKPSADFSSREENLRERISLAAAEKRRQDSALEAKERQEAAERDAKNPAIQLALKLKKERDMKLAAEQAIQDAEQAAKSIAYWNKRWGKS